jgi:hypothetical protein
MSMFPSEKKLIAKPFHQPGINRRDLAQRRTAVTTLGPLLLRPRADRNLTYAVGIAGEKGGRNFAAARAICRRNAVLILTS